MSDLTTLRTLGEQLLPPPLDSLRATARLRDRRAVQVGISAASLTVLAVAGTVFATMDDKAEPAPAPPVPTVSTRPITFADGKTIHYGDKIINAAGIVREVDITDDGVGFRTADGRIWFTDGTTTDEIGELGDPIVPGPAYDRWVPEGRYQPASSSTNWMNSANSGSMLVWFEFHTTGGPDVMAYNTQTRDIVLQTEVAIPDGSWVGLHSVGVAAAYFFMDPDPFADDILPQVRLDLATGAQTSITREEYLAELSANPARSLRLSHAEGEFRLYEITDGARQQFAIDNRQFVPMGMQPFVIRDGLTNQRIETLAPEGYRDRNPTWLMQWLDDDTIVMSVENGDQQRGQDLLVCPVPTGVCEVAVSVPPSAVLPEIG